MQRVAFVLKLKPGQVDAYRRTHEAVWPEMIEANRQAGVRNHTMFLYGNLAFGYLECDDYARTQELLAQFDVVTRWGELHAEIIEPDPATGRLGIELLEEVFHQD